MIKDVDFQIFIKFVSDMGRKASTLDEQIALLQNRGMIISDVNKEKSIIFASINSAGIDFRLNANTLKREKGGRTFRCTTSLFIPEKISLPPNRPQ